MNLNLTQQIDQLVTQLMKRKSTEDLQGLVEETHRLSGLSLLLASAVGDWHEAKSDAEYMYKTAVNQYIMNAQGAFNLREKMAKIEYSEMEKTWVKAENQYQKLKLKLGQVNAILDQCRQTISYFKEEKKNG